MLVAMNEVRLLFSVVFKCTVHFFPVSERRTMISLLSDKGVKYGTSMRTGARKVAGASWRILQAKPSPSLRGGRVSTWSGRSWRQVIRTGCSALWGGITIRIPDFLLPVMDPPLASTRKLIRKSILHGLSSICDSILTQISPDFALLEIWNEE